MNQKVFAGIGNYLKAEILHECKLSPHCNVQDLTDDEYWKMITKVFEEVYRVTESGGRLVVNVANLGRKPYIPFSKFFIQIDPILPFAKTNLLLINELNN